jgi:hypothetical protein
VGGNPHSFYFLSFDFVCFVFVMFFKTSVLLQVWGTFANVIPKVFFSFGVVFLVILGTMCHFSLGVEKTLLSISCHLLLFVCFIFSFRKKKKKKKLLLCCLLA